jgi:hypothetical protein
MKRLKSLETHRVTTAKTDLKVQYAFKNVCFDTTGTHAFDARLSQLG